MPTNIDLCYAIRDHPELLGIAHSKLDCQAAVERALSLVGVRVNYKGSNDMWRHMVHDRSTISDFKQAHDGQLVPGMICFVLKYDGSEEKRGYHDDMGAATHVGIILDTNTAFQSASRGTEIIDINKTAFNRVAYCDHLTYIPDEQSSNELIHREIEITAAIDHLKTAINILKGLI